MDSPFFLRFIPYSILSATVNNSTSPLSFKLSTFLLLSLFYEATPLSTTYLSNRVRSVAEQQSSDLPLILAVPIITSNSYRYAQCSTLTTRQEIFESSRTPIANKFAVCFMIHRAILPAVSIGSNIAKRAASINNEADTKTA